MNDFIAENSWKIGILFAAILVAYISVCYFGKDNPIEQEAEKIIELETGITIDLTP